MDNGKENETNGPLRSNTTNMNTNTNKDNVMDDTATRFSLIELDLDSSAPAPVAAPAPAPDVTGDAFAGSPGVSAEGKARAVADELAAIEAGFSIKPPVYEIGRVVNATGVENFRASRASFDAMPTATEACEKLADLIRSENREDIVVDVPSLRMNNDGTIVRGGGSLALSERALTGVGTHITPGGGSYLRACPADLRAMNFNRWCELGYREDARATSRAVEEWYDNGGVGDKPGPVMIPKEVTLRTRTNHTNGSREAFAVVGPRYTAHDIDKLAEQIMTSSAIPGDARCDVVYDGYRARIDVLFHTDVRPEKAVAGEIFKAGIMLKTADDGSGSIQISAQVWRNLCLNLIIIDHAKELVTRRKHYGSGIVESVSDGIASAMKKIGHFSDKWSEASMENVIERYGVHDVDAVLRGLVYNKVVHVPGVKPADMFDRLLRAYQAEPGYGKTAIVNAVTRVAHTESWSRWTDVEDLERTGGELLYAKVWNVAIPESEAASLDY